MRAPGPLRVPNADDERDSDDCAAERALVARCVRGDALAWRQVYDRHFPAVERLVFALGIRDAEADDLCQEIFVLLYRHLPRFRGDSRLGTWVYRIATREALRFARRRRLRRQLVEMFAREPLRLPAEGVEGTLGRRQLVQQLLDRLPAERRLALVLFELEGVPVAEIARLCNCAENTIWTRLHRARADLERLVREADR